MNYVEVKADGDNLKSVTYALRQLKAQMKKDGTLEELKRREHYLAPSAKKRMRRNEAQKRRKREDRKHTWYLHNKQNPEV